MTFAVAKRRIGMGLRIRDAVPMLVLPYRIYSLPCTYSDGTQQIEFG